MKEDAIEDIDTKAYKLSIYNLARLSSKGNFSPFGSEHYNIVIANIFRFARNEVKILAYDDIVVDEFSLGYLKKYYLAEKNKLTVLLTKKISSDSLVLSLANEFGNENIEIWQAPDSNRCCFTIADKRMSIYQISDVKYFSSFCNNDMFDSLNLNFNALKKGAKKIN